MCDNFQYLDMYKNLPENLATTGLYRNNSAFYRTLQNVLCIYRQKNAELFLYT
jgi:hypothetical protein